MDNKFINVALREAKKAYLKNEVPVGAVIVKNGEIISKAHNLKLKNNDIFNHAEILAIKRAVKKLHDWRLVDCEMYVTLEPCPMCASAIQQSRIKIIYFGTTSNITANSEIIGKILDCNEFYHQVDYVYMNDKNCSEILSSFFENKR